MMCRSIFSVARVAAEMWLSYYDRIMVGKDVWSKIKGGVRL